MSAAERGDPESAEGYYRRALAASPGSPLVMNNLACLVFDRPGRREEGVEIAADAVRLQRAQRGLWATYGWLLLRAGRPGEALQGRYRLAAGQHILDGGGGGGAWRGVVFHGLPLVVAG